MADEMLHNQIVQTHASSNFIRKAWNQVFLPFANDYELKHTGFGHYFFKFPKNGIIPIVFYIITAGWIIHPFMSALKVGLEFPLTFGYQGFKALKKELSTSNPQSLIGIFFNELAKIGCDSGAILFSLAHVLMRTISSPLTSFKAGKEISPVLGFLSALTSLLSYGVLILVALPFVMSIIVPHLAAVGSVMPILQGIVNILAYPANYVAALMGGSISTIVAAHVTLITGFVVRKIAELTINKLFVKNRIANITDEMTKKSDKQINKLVVNPSLVLLSAKSLPHVSNAEKKETQHGSLNPLTSTNSSNEVGKVGHSVSSLRSMSSFKSIDLDDTTSDLDAESAVNSESSKGKKRQQKNRYC